MADEAWQSPDQSWREAIRWLFMSYLQAFAADGDGPPNWWWPSIMLFGVTFLEFFGLWKAPDKSAYASASLPWYGGFVLTNLTTWLTYKGWSRHMTKRAAVNTAVETKTAMTMTSETKSPTPEAVGIASVHP